ncbi:hypothetical protein N0V88_000959 [Collariella sp. IMI 366227]|nr:hypothetical protein N0V88_000959 [Collariella sp. IMI 366227]
MSAIQLSFSLRVSSGVKTVHLLGSWDNYSGQLPLSKDRTSSKSGTWKGTFRFQQASLQPGSRYWYYYIIDGYHVSHNPSEDSTVEPTTGRALNILDVPKAKSSSSSKSSSRKSTSHKRVSVSDNIPKGRPPIKSPRPVAPHATRHILDKDFDEEELSNHFAATGLYDNDTYYEDVITDFGHARDSPASSTGSSLSYRSDSSGSSSGYSTPSASASASTAAAPRCSYDDSCSSEEEDAEYVERSSRRNGIVVRH